MNLHIERGLVVAVLRETGSVRELLVEVSGVVERAFQEPAFGVSADVGDDVLLNTTAVRLQLGTGGMHFVVAVLKNGELAADQTPGHIMKLRYTPLQMAVHAVEEVSHPMHERMRDADSLDGTPVVICELHSMLPAVAMSLHYQWMLEQNCKPQYDSHKTHQYRLPPELHAKDHLQRERTQSTPKVAYVMTDGGALPLHISKTVAELKRKGLLAGTVTVGHAYGGDLEAVTLYSGLLAAKHVLHADCIIVGMGPGIVGTGTRFGHTGVEVGQAVNAVHALQGEAVVVPRISFADPRARHHGISHHTLTALGKVALVTATVPLPDLPEGAATLLWEQLTSAGLHLKHRLIPANGWSILDAAPYYAVPLRTMGRSLQEDQAFFLAAGAAGEWVARLMKNPPQRYARRVASPVFTDKNC